MGLEVSRLARNSSDWHRLVEICALTKTLILDEEGIYDPTQFNDRLLLGLKGTMSEAELHVIRARMQGGMKAKAQRGELKLRLPVGFVHDARDKIVLDPDKRIQESIRLFFSAFRRLGGAGAVVREFKSKGLEFPRRIFSGPQKGMLLFAPLTLSRVMQVLKNPRYAGAYAYGIRQQQYRSSDQKLVVKFVDPKDWQVCLWDSHQGYISREEYEENLERLRANSAKMMASRKCAPREGPALLQGLAVCGLCGRRMAVRYHNRRGKVLSPDYCCSGPRHQYLEPHCPTISGHVVDELIGQLLLEKMHPAVLEVALSVQDELKEHIEETDRLRYKHVEHARYEMDYARKRYMVIDPHNRLVADELEAEWNSAIRSYRDAQEHYEKMKEKDRLILTEQQRGKILTLVTDFPKLWSSDATADKDRKRMLRLLIEDVTLTKGKNLLVQIRYKGGASEEHALPLPKNGFEERKHSPEVVKAIDALLDHHTDSEVAENLNDKGMLSGTGKTFDARRVSRIRRDYRLPSRYYRLRQKGLLTIHEVGEQFNVSRHVVYKWRKTGKLKAHRFDDVGRYLYELTPELNSISTGGAV
jgi:DNA invertase Pin-like site-specific DNA recombinase